MAAGGAWARRSSTGRYASREARDLLAGRGFQMREGGGRLVRGAPVLRGTAWALVLFLGFLATVAGNTVNVRGILALTAGDGAITGGVLSSSQSATLRLALGDTVPDSTVLILAQRARDPAHDVGFEAGAGFVRRSTPRPPPQRRCPGWSGCRGAGTVLPDRVWHCICSSQTPGLRAIGDMVRTHLRPPPAVRPSGKWRRGRRGTGKRRRRGGGGVGGGRERGGGEEEGSLGERGVGARDGAH
ncbi:hypothetical protein T484DRAFT_3005106 [Baffinella frigidus]|nr:hypothetical protein T484DRAFT_3005106 [Cryptophyta sp. CCMP2293]